MIWSIAFGSTLGGARFCLTQNQITRQLGSETTQCTSPLSNRIPHCSDRSQFFSFLLQSFRSFCGNIGNGITKNYCALLTTTTCGPVAATFFGGLTYIGNRPNLLIRAIAESRHMPTPGFLTYIIRYARPILMPVLGLVGLIFFRG